MVDLKECKVAKLLMNENKITNQPLSKIEKENFCFILKMKLIFIMCVYLDVKTVFFRGIQL